MSIIKQNIMESAVRFFSEKGYIATSIQDIADDCGIAKGSLYKFFPSKEELFIEVHRTSQISLLTEIEKIRADQTVSLRENLIRETEYEFNYLILNKFLIQDFKELKVDGKITPLLFHLRGNILNMRRNALRRRFGAEIDPHIWDLVVLFNGIFHEYLFTMIFEGRPLNVRDVSVFIVDRFEDVVASVIAKKPQPILQNAEMNNYVESVCAGNSIPVAEFRNKLIEMLFTTINELNITNFRKNELREALVILQDEVALDLPKTVLIRAILQFLKEEPTLKGSIGQLEMLAFKRKEGF